MFLILVRNILFPSLRNMRYIMSNNVSATMCPRLPGMSRKLRPKTWKTKTRKTKTWKTKTLFFLGEIIKFQLSSPLSGKMNEINALTLTNDNLVVFLFPCMANETISGYE